VRTARSGRKTPYRRDTRNQWFRECLGIADLTAGGVREPAVRERPRCCVGRDSIFPPYILNTEREQQFGGRENSLPALFMFIFAQISASVGSGVVAVVFVVVSTTKGIARGGQQREKPATQEFLSLVSRSRPAPAATCPAHRASWRCSPQLPSSRRDKPLWQQRPPSCSHGIVDFSSHTSSSQELQVSKKITVP